MTLLKGFNHVAVLTSDTERLHAFYRDVFDATTTEVENNDEVRLSFIAVGPGAMLNVFQIKGNASLYPPGTAVEYVDALSHPVPTLCDGPAICQVSLQVTPPELRTLTVKDSWVLVTELMAAAVPLATPLML